MFDTGLVDEVPGEDLPVDGSWFDAPFDEASFDDVVPEPTPWSQCRPSGWLGLDLDGTTTTPDRLDDAELIEAIVGFERMSAWAAARQARLLAEFARRRPAIDDESRLQRSEAPSRYSEFAADEVGLALHLSRTIAADRLYTAGMLAAELPGTWQRGSRGPSTPGRCGRSSRPPCC